MRSPLAHFLCFCAVVAAFVNPPAALGILLAAGVLEAFAVNV